jgi:maleylpyruvate isomerase
VTGERPADDIAGSLAAHATLLGRLATLTDAQARQSSRLPGWTVGHVLTHLARNADSHVRSLTAAAEGREGVARYAIGTSQRADEIEAGAHRPAAELVADVTSSIAALERCWETCPDAAWAVVGRSGTGAAEPVERLPWKRWREVEVHHSDLGLGFGFEHWSSGYVRRELRLAEMAWRASKPMGLTPLPAAANALPPATRLAWLLGRLEIDGLPAAPPWL